MDLLLGRTGHPGPSSIAPGAPPVESAPVFATAAPITEEDLLATQGQEMPEHKEGDVRKTMAAFRMFVGG